jgi:putative DNA primase/helicase
VWLSARPQWIVWRVEARGDDLSKVPYAVETGTRVDATDLLGWSSFEDAVEAYRSSGGFYSGLGFCLASCDPFVAIDLDGCRDPESGEIAPWARKLIERVPDAYPEVSPSGTGLHLILEAKVRAGGLRRGRLELYSRDRFIALTGVLP